MKPRVLGSTALCLFLALSLPVSAGEIHVAAREGDVEGVKALLASDPELLNARNENGMTPLHHASRGVHP